MGVEPDERHEAAARHEARQKGLTFAKTGGDLTTESSGSEIVNMDQ